MKMLQLWCYYEPDERWFMEGFYESREEADAALRNRQADAARVMTNWKLIPVTDVS